MTGPSQSIGNRPSVEQLIEVCLRLIFYLIVLVIIYIIATTTIVLYRSIHGQPSS